MSRVHFKLITAISILLFCTEPFSRAQADDASDNSPDPGVKAALESTDLKFEISKGGNFHITLPTKGDRTQLVCVDSKTQKYGKSEIREVWSIAYESNGPLTSQVANKLLEENMEWKMGAWCIEKDDDMSRTLVFVVKVDADCSAKALKDAIVFAAGVADDKELELTNKDEF